MAAAYIKHCILTGDFKPGDRIVVGRIAQELGVSDTPVREAIKSLVSAGVLAETPHVGTTVPKFGLEAIREAFEMRAALGALAIRLNGPYFDESVVRRLDERLRECKDCLDRGDVAGYGVANMKFHATLTDTGHFPFLHRTLTELWEKMERFRAGFKLIPRRVSASYEEHVAIRDAIAAGDFERAAECMRSHELAAMKALIAYAEQQGQFGGGISTDGDV